MITWKSIKRFIRQSSAIIERDIFFEARFKLLLISHFIEPIIQVLMPLIIFGVIFTIREDYNFGYWTSETYLLFMLIAFTLQFIRQIIPNFKDLFLREKFWKTIQALIVAPINRYILLVGILISEMLLISIPIIIFFMLAYILFPISFINIILVIIVFLSISLIFGSIGLISGILALTQEGFYRIFSFGLTLIFWLSCLSYPLQIFPDIIQKVILLNPLYYIIDLIRLVWFMGIDFNTAISYLSIFHIIFIILLTVTLPSISVYLFNTFYDKYGISGY